MNSRQLYVLFYYIYYTLLASLLFGGLFFLVFGCSHDSLCYEHPHGVTIVRFDWSEAPEAAPSEVRAVFFPLNGEAPLTEDFAGSDGGVVRLSPGLYRVAGFNGATSAVHWRGEDWGSYEAYTREASLTEDLPGVASPVDSLGELLVLAPDRLWVGSVDSVWTTETDTTVVTIVPRRVTYRVHWTVEGIDGAERVLFCRATLSGMAGTWRLSDTLPATIPVQLPSEGLADTLGGGRAAGELEVFGCAWGADCRHILTLYCWSESGNVKASFDVTDQMHVVLPEREIHVVVRGDIRIPGGPGEKDESGFRPDVGAWEENDEELIL